MRKKIVAILCMMLLLVSGITGCSRTNKTSEVASGEKNNVVMAAEKQVQPKTTKTEKQAKYIFLFIGDGMSYPQIQSAADYLGTIKYKDKIQAESLSFMSFPVAGSAQTFDSTSFCPDSASTATSIATGKKTYSGTINMDTTYTETFETIAEKLKAQKDFKIGIISTVNLNHATPAAFYGHQPSRNNYYELGLELIDSKFDYFAGGAFLQPTGKEGTEKDLYELAKEAGYEVIDTSSEVEKLTTKDIPAIIIDEKLADSDSMSYQMDTNENQLVLADYVKKGIEVLDNENGFFMMVEGGKIDWACHANDAAAAVNDTIALADAVDEAIAFYQEHPEETLIIVTGDHETGGLTIGFAGTNYDTYLENLSYQKLSYAKFDSDYVASYKEKGTSFEEVLEDIKENFGLMTAKDKDAEENSLLVLTDYEYEKLKDSYDKTMEKEKEELSQEEYLLYGTYEPLTVTITHLLNNKSGISFSSYSHTGLPVPVFAKGVQEESFEGYYDNTQIYEKMAVITGVQ